MLERRLPNGLRILCEQVSTAPVVAIQAWVGVGSADELPREAGLAHLHEHMLFKGTARRGVGEIAQEIEAAGGEVNAWTSPAGASPSGFSPRRSAAIPTGGP